MFNSGPCARNRLCAMKTPSIVCNRSHVRQEPPVAIPVILSTLVRSAELLPLHFHWTLCLGALLTASSGLTAGLMDVPFRADFLDFASAATVITVSAVIAARSTSHHIRIHQAQVSAMEAGREAEAARERALLAESAISIRRPRPRRLCRGRSSDRPVQCTPPHHVLVSQSLRSSKYRRCVLVRIGSNLVSSDAR